MTFGDDWGWGSTKDESREIYDAFVEAGRNFIDTTDLYANGTSAGPSEPGYLLIPISLI